ncbi:hypothetical protein K439DRAFT_49811 [Ramaria rubella]|nr:hypothetical protein K439DRAFT_49811 [Ramaria rubella]
MSTENEIFTQRFYPDDILDHCFAYLSPTVEVLEPFMWEIIGDRRDLMRCRLVCRQFFEIATPWFWKVLGLRSSFDPLEPSDPHYHIMVSILAGTVRQGPYESCQFCLSSHKFAPT